MELKADTDIRFLKGVGEKRAQLYHKLQISTVGELLRYYPRRYLDLTEPVPIMAAPLGENAAVLAYYRGLKEKKLIRKGLTIFHLLFSDGLSDLHVSIFNSQYTVDKLMPDVPYILYGKVDNTYHRRQMASPLIERADQVVSLQPIYALTKGLTNKMLCAQVKQALEGTKEVLTDVLQMCIRDSAGTGCSV